MLQGLILDPFLFNNFLAVLSFVLKDVDTANFADDNTPYSSAKNTNVLIESLEKASPFSTFKSNHFKGNPNKCHLIVSTNPKTNVNIGELNIESSQCKKLLGVKIDNNLRLACF